ncbi:ATP-binding protein [Dapis sp. BLCC M172]|uniref:ATP-binding protein n=1 Tax=Dapis sp. BLCC M172 TaxID=2975281 RepID=UPI003CF779A5
MSEPRKPLHPVISYNHILSELSVNREDPCEVIRELISNSYDAKASQIQIYPLLQEKGFIFFDNGTGLSETKETNGITPYRAFFSIGKSTKVEGESIGYKCQGSKLCFASKKITIITRCSDEPSWRYISIDNPQKNINESFDISSHCDYRPWDTLSQLFLRPKNPTKNILKELNQDFFTNHFNYQGTMIIIEGLEVQDFSDFYSSNEYGKNEWSYLKNYIRFNTRHGDMRILRPSYTGFPQRREVSFRETIGYNDQCQLFLWSMIRYNKYGLHEIKPGYPYLKKPDATEKIKTPAELSSLYSGKFSGRYCSTFLHDEITYCITLAIDGNKRALEKYPELGRKGYSKSGIKLVDQRGTFISSEGVKICPYNKIFEHSSLEKYSILADKKAQSHYILIINGSFSVVTNRNSLTDDSKQILKDNSFLEHIKNFLDEAQDEAQGKVPVFRELIERLNKENEETRLAAYRQKLDKLKKGIQYRTRFKVNNIEQLKDKWIVGPKEGEEHWVGALYTMFSHLVTVDSPYAKLWVRPITFRGFGIDSIALPLEENTFKYTAYKGLEYKYNFSEADEYNHPFTVTNFIVCWDMPIPKEGEQIKDAYEYFGYVSLTEELDDIGYEIVEIQSQTGKPHYENIKVISLYKLLKKTFDCQFITPPQPK